MTAPGALATGTKIDRYRLLERIGGGGAGTVYAAEETGSGERFAVKILRGALTDDAPARARFLREARAANDVDHPAIVPVVDTGTLPDGRPYLVLPLLEGRSLREALSQTGRFAPGEAWRVLRPVAEGLARAHTRGVIHRDVKPDNVFLANTQQSTVARLLDFGLARTLDGEAAEQAAKLTQTGVPVGTPAYMAPEQWWGLPPSPSIDQYAFGATLFELLTGRPPFEASSFAALVEKHLHAPPPSPGDAGAPVAAEIDAFVRKLLAKDPADRFPSMDAALAAGDVAFSQQSSDAPQLSGDLRITEPAAALDSAVRITEPAPALARPSRSALARFLPWHIGVIALGFGLLVAVGYTGEGRRDLYEWFRIGGYSQMGNVVWFLAAAVVLPLSARRHPHDSPSSAFVWALAPAVNGVIGTYPNFRAVEAGILRAGGLEKFRVFCMGTYEANAARFLGFALSSILCASLVALPAVTASGSAPALPRAERRARAAALSALAVLALAAALLGAPSGALVAATASACLLCALLFTTSASPAPLAGSSAISAGAELARAAASLLAIGLAFAVGVARVEARQAVLWVEPATRAARVAEIHAARAEMNATLLIGAAAIVGAAVPIALTLVRAARTAGFSRPSRAVWLIVTAVALAGAFDLVLLQRTRSRREEIRSELAPQFSAFVHLDPPPADALDPARFRPQRSTALQIAKGAVAIDGRGVTKLAALDTETGLFLVTAQLHQALAQASVERGDSDIDLTVIADESVPFGRIALLLGVARAGGAKRASLLFRRGPRPQIATDAAPEAAYVVPSDFVAATIELADAGFTAPAGDPWSAVAPAFLEAVSDLARSDAADSDGRAVSFQAPRTAARPASKE